MTKLEAAVDAIAAKGATARIVVSWPSAAELARAKQAEADEFRCEQLRQQALKGGGHGYAAKLR
jgi:hypothetical protein